MPGKSNRRSFLKGAGSAAAGAAVPATASAASSRGADDPVPALDERLKAAEQRWLRAIAARDEAEQRIVAAGGGLPEHPSVLVGGERCGSPEEVIAACNAANGGLRSTFATLLADYLRRQRDGYEALRAALGLASIDAAEHAARAALDEAERAFATARSTSLDGVRAKLRRAQQGIDAEAFETAEAIIASALVDIEGMRVADPAHIRSVTASPRVA